MGSFRLVDLKPSDVRWGFKLNVRTKLIRIFWDLKANFIKLKTLNSEKGWFGALNSSDDGSDFELNNIVSPYTLSVNFNYNEYSAVKVVKFGIPCTIGDPYTFYDTWSDLKEVKYNVERTKLNKLNSF